MSGEMIKVGKMELRQRPPEGGALFSYDVKTDEGKRGLHRAFVSSDGLAKRHVGASLSIVHYLCHRVERRDEDTGEIRMGLRTVYVLSDGKRITSSSEPLWDSFCTLCSIFQLQAPFDPPLVVVIRSGPTSHPERDYLYFDLP